MYVTRTISAVTKQLADQYPVVTITGPRQSGKTTLVKHLFPEKKYVNLEHIENREFASSDPVGFIDQFRDGAILDEVQRVPELLSYIQVVVDEKQENNIFVLTGSQHFTLMQHVTQSLAGRTALLKLLPFSIQETSLFYKTSDWIDYLYRGFFPRIYDQKLNPTQALRDYFETYVERDVRQLSQIHNLNLFQKFIKMCAGRVGQILNLSSLADDVGITHTTARDWISLLQTSYILFFLEPFHQNIRKRLIKSPKLYFYDVGLASNLLGIENETHLVNHPLMGNLFENLVVAEVLKMKHNLNFKNELNFFRDSKGHEIDLIYHIAQHTVLIVIKSGKTINTDFFKGFDYFEKVLPDLPFGSVLIYGGDKSQKRHNIQITHVWEAAEIIQSIQTAAV